MTAALGVALHRDPIPSGAVRLTELAPWIRPNRGDRYWHRPRSAFRYQGRLVVDYWCGMSGPRTAAGRLADAPPARAIRCATCVGRERGYRRRGGLVFRPRDHFALPKVCPAPFGDRFCLCGEKLRWWGAYTSWPAKHAPGPLLEALFRPCPSHGWRDGRIVGLKLVCFAWRGSGHGECGFDMGPRS